MKAGGKLCHLATSLHAGFMLGLFLDLENGCDVFLRNVDLFSTDYTVLYPENITVHNHRFENLKS
jgi:hypothetical protein